MQDIKYTLNAMLKDNTVTENPDDQVLEIVSQGTADRERIIAEMMKVNPGLEQETLDFVNAFLSSTIPDVVKEAALFNLSTLRSQTVFRLPDGHLMGWEGVMDRFGSCQGTCTHVWNYEVATPFLFGELAQTMRDVELNYATKENGLMNFRAALPLSEAAKRNAAAADGQMGCVMKVYREWQLSGDRAFLERNWEQTRKILSYAWTERGWDGNRNGEYYEHRITDPKTFEFLNIDSAGCVCRTSSWARAAW